MNVDFNKLRKAELVHIVTEMIGTVRTMNYVRKCVELQIENKKADMRPCYECMDIAKKLNII